MVDNIAHMAEPLAIHNPMTWLNSIKQINAGSPVIWMLCNTHEPFIANMEAMFVQVKAAMNWAIKKAMTKKFDNPLTAWDMHWISVSAFVIFFMEMPYVSPTVSKKPQISGIMPRINGELSKECVCGLRSSPVSGKASRKITAI